MTQTHNSLVEAWSVGILIFLDDGHYESDQFGPEVEVLDAGALFFWGNFPFLGLDGAVEKLATRGPGMGASAVHY